MSDSDRDAPSAGCGDRRTRTSPRGVRDSAFRRTKFLRETPRDPTRDGYAPRKWRKPALRETCTPSLDLDEVCEDRSEAERRFSRGPGAVAFSRADARLRADRQGSSQLIFRNIERARAYVDDLFKPSSTSAHRRFHAKFFCPNQPRGKRQIIKGE